MKHSKVACLTNVKVCKKCNRDCVYKQIWEDRGILGCYDISINDDVKVERCPFCGGSIKAWEQPTLFAKMPVKYTAAVECCKCNAKVHVYQGSDTIGVSLHKAIKNWNKRQGMRNEQTD